MAQRISNGGLRDEVKLGPICFPETVVATGGEDRRLWNKNWGIETSRVPLGSDEEESSGPVWRGVLPRRLSAQVADSLVLSKERGRGLGSCSSRLLTAESGGRLSAGQNPWVMTAKFRFCGPSRDIGQFINSLWDSGEMGCSVLGGAEIMGGYRFYLKYTPTPSSVLGTVFRCGLLGK